MDLHSTLHYAELPERAELELERLAELMSQGIDDEEIARFAHVEPRSDKDGDVEVLDDVEFTHRFVQAPGDSELLTWHYVEAGEGEPVVFLHGIPDSWYQWHHQMAVISQTHRCIAVDLKGYGQSDKRPGDYRHEGVAEQLLTLLDTIGLDKFNLVSHDRGSVQADYLTANHPDRVLRYARGEQHLYHFNPRLAPQEPVFSDAFRNGIMDDPARLVLALHKWIATRPILDADTRRAIQEFSYPGISDAVPRYFHSSSFRKEWIDRRTRLLEAWRCPVMIIEGYESRTQPRELYEDAPAYIPNAEEVTVRYIDSGHYWSLENPEQTTETIVELLDKQGRE